MMTRRVATTCIVTWWLLLPCATGCPRAAAQQPAGADRQKVVIPFDLESVFDQGRYGRMVGDMIWKKLERRGGYILPESMLDVRSWSERAKVVPNPDTPLDRMRSILRDDFGADIAIWGKVERLADVAWDEYDLWLNIVDFSTEPPRIITQLKARTRTASEIPHKYVDQALDRLDGVQPAAADAGSDVEAEKRWETGPNLVQGDFETAQGWDPPGRFVSRPTEPGQDGRPNHFLRFTIPRDVAETSGVLYYSDFFPIQEGAQYRFQCRWRTSAPAAKVFIKCYTERPTRFAQRSDGSTEELEKREVYRSQQNLAGATDTWHIHTEDFTPRHAQFVPRFGRVMLYGYLSDGTLDWDDIVVKQIAPPPATHGPRPKGS